MSKIEKNADNGIITEFVDNKNGVNIKKCCASCIYKEPYDAQGPRRLCTKRDKLVDKSDCCGDWLISEAIDKIKLRA